MKVSLEVGWMRDCINGTQASRTCLLRYITLLVASHCDCSQSFGSICGNAASTCTTSLRGTAHVCFYDDSINGSYHFVKITAPFKKTNTRDLFHSLEEDKMKSSWPTLGRSSFQSSWLGLLSVKISWVVNGCLMVRLWYWLAPKRRFYILDQCLTSQDHCFTPWQSHQRVKPSPRTDQSRLGWRIESESAPRSDPQGRITSFYQGK